MAIERLNPLEVSRPIGHYSHIASVPPGYSILMLAGQVGALADGSFPVPIEEQFELAMKACLDLLQSQGASAADIVKVTYYLTERPEDFPRIRAAIVASFGDTPPAATYLVVAGLARPEIKVEIDVMAAVQK